MPKFGADGQTRLKQSHVLIVGAGGLGSPVSLYLAAAGIGEITIVDPDKVELSNLQRQVAFDESKIGSFKVDATIDRLSALNSELKLNPVKHHFSPDNAAALIANADLVLDCTDNFSTRYLINDTCKALGKAWIFASIHQFSGQCALFTPTSPCFRCLYPEFPEGIEDCNSAGVLGVLPGLLGCLQASEALKYLAGISSPLEGQLQLVDAMNLNFQRVKLSKDLHCTVCSEGREPLTDFYHQPVCDTNIEKLEISALRFDELRDSENCVVIDVRSEAERNAFNLGGDHISPNQLTDARFEEQKGKIILCYCQSGVRSLAAAQKLTELGYRAMSLNGGIAEYLRQSGI